MEDIGKKSSIKIVVKVNMPKTEIIGYDAFEDSYRMNVHAAAEDNKANREIVKFLSRISGREARIAIGMTGKRKVIRFY